ncbi:hypothetical protein [Nocardia heshunensis]
MAQGEESAGFRGGEPSRLRTLAQLRAEGLVPKTIQKPAAYLERIIDGDVWRTELYDAAAAEATVGPTFAPDRSGFGSILPGQALVVVGWTRHSLPIVDGRRVDFDRPTKLHASTDRIHTVCRVLIPEIADVVTDDTSVWHLHVTCYNCAFRLWKTHAPEGFCRPRNGDDFPPQRICGHGNRADECLVCASPGTSRTLEDEPPF